MPSDLPGFATWLASSGPVGVIALLMYALWRMHERKDAALRELFEKVAEISKAQTIAIVKVEAALVALKEAIERVRGD